MIYHEHDLYQHKCHSHRWSLLYRSILFVWEYFFGLWMELFPIIKFWSETVSLGSFHHTIFFITISLGSGVFTVYVTYSPKLIGKLLLCLFLQLIIFHFVISLIDIFSLCYFSNCADTIKDLLWNTKIDGNPIHLKEHILHFGLNK